MIKIGPSLLAADFGRLAEEVAKVAKAGADYLHVDVMDGHFVPNITIGPPVVAALRPHTRLPLDVHLMIEKPDVYLPAFMEAGADLVTVHAETCPHLHRTISRIKESGRKAGVALNPATPPETLAYVLSLVDVVLVMTVNPGFGGQSFIREMVPKIETVAAMLARAGAVATIQVDGGIDPETAPVVVRAGATMLVAGSAIFGASDPARALHQIRTAAVLNTGPDP